MATEWSLCCGKIVSCDLDQPPHQSGHRRWAVSNRYGYACSHIIPVDNVAHVWWYDNEGAIQSHGIDFVTTFVIIIIPR